MLQQTQVVRVIPKYQAWLEAFPSLADLAAAPLSEALRLWSGLGYNRRGKWLWESARSLMEGGGQVPRDAAALETLPGVGPYTARAVLTFAFGSPEVFIETNIRRVFIHFFFPPSVAEGGEAAKVSDAQILPLVEASLDRQNPREWYYALMDYGAALPKVTSNSNARSKTYKIQSTFRGSRREARGAIMRAIAAGPTDLDEIALRSGISRERLEEACRSLQAEGLVAETEAGYTIPG
jgi:A/G-specific adenine glycosylase